MIDFRHKDIAVNAIGRGGIETCYILPAFQLAFDTGRCPDGLIDMPRVFLTHGHLDHSAGLPYYISQRSLRHLPPPEIYCPAEIVAPLREILHLWQKIEGFEYPVALKGLSPGDEIPVRKDLYVRALASSHRVPCRGYALVRKTRKLKDEYLTVNGREIKRMKDRGEAIFEDRDIPIFAFSGDTTIEFLQDNQAAREATVLFIECTYIDDKRPVARAREWGHIHLDEIIAHAHLFKNEKIVLTHFSKRYNRRFILQVLNKKLQDHDLLSRIFVLAHDD
ncbi:MBL fold metallo-hydrolase [Turneriella parva]|uniref:Metallo-beta-lactamase n=1 Tax=Turneriella parva (strain ATCC BAA-1111 / DSM 21527 / NCTC 11395 / H) TaxID=869212 RepID=I4B5P8_TURPD|nr:MBL fold metallo-hydrolase [Turneriella parva]AFM12605.1 metallo-beta-lactamase [Turneriella parva DSM 21527]